MNDEERLRALVRALLPFALAADDPNVRHASINTDLLLLTDGEDRGVSIEVGGWRWLTVADLRAAMTAIITAGYADALTDDSARAALEGDE